MCSQIVMDHGVGSPAVHLAEDAERGHVAEGEDVVVGVFQGRPIVEHEQHAGHGLDENRKNVMPPMHQVVAKRDAAFAHRHGVQVQEHVGQHHHDAVTAVARAGWRKMLFQTCEVRM